MSINLELYKVFCEVAKYKNFSKAAEQMYVSQSAITQSIQKLENQLGGKVFYRNKRGVELTEEGKNLYEFICNSIETLNNAEALFSEYTTLDKGRIRIAGGNSLVNSMIVEPMMKFSKQYPNIKFDFFSGLIDTLVQQLVNGEVDVVALNLPFDTSKYANIEVVPLRKSNYCFFCSEAYAKEHSIKKIDDTKDCKFIFPRHNSTKNAILEDYIKDNNLELNEFYEVTSTSMMTKMVANDLGIGFAKVDVVNEKVDKFHIIEELQIDDAYEGIAMLDKHIASKATNEFVKEIKAYYNIKK